MIHRARLTLLIAAALPFIARPARAENGVGKPSRHLERPSVQAGVPGTSASVQTTHLFPAGTGSIEFDYVIDSEAGDVLEVFALGYSNVALWTMSGLNKGGRKVLTFNLAAPTNITARFRYRKDADAIHEGRDTAWIDRVLLRGGNGDIVYSSTFNDETLGAVPTSWTGVGTGGGFKVSTPPISRSAARPAGQAHGTTTFMERTIFFPVSTGGIDFDYFTDSEEGRDYLELLVDGVNQDLEPDVAGVQGISGLNRSGHISVPVPTSGNHVVRVQYAKDTAGSAGLDIARVDRFRARFGAPFVEEFHDFGGRISIGGGIRHEGGGPTEWTGTWIVDRSTLHRTYVPPQTPLAKWAVDWATFSEPTIDGLIGNEYKNPVRIDLRNFGNSGIMGLDGRMMILASNGGGGTTVFVALRAQSRDVAPGNESGRLRLFFDAAHRRTLIGSGTCHSAPTLPAAEDRMIDLSYTFSGPVTFTPPQLRGACNAATPWVATTSAQPPWDITVSMSEPAADPGFVHIELEIVLPAQVAAEELLGFGLIRENVGGTPAKERFPYVDDNFGPMDNDTRSLETIRLHYVTGQAERSEDAWDAGAFPRVSRPRTHW